MIRLTWRQFRTQAVVAIAALAALVAVLAFSNPHPVQLPNALRSGLGFLVAVVPAVIGIFWGAPLVAGEIEGGTFGLVWTQSVSRGRWLNVKVGVVGLASMAAAGLLSLLVTRWAHPLDLAAMNHFATFDQRDLAPIGYAAFAFVLGVSAGTLIRRTLPAMATTLVAYVTIRVTVAHAVLPRLVGPSHVDLALNPVSTGFGSEVSGLSGLFSLFGGGPSSSLQPSPPNLPNAWIYSTRIVDRAGRELTNSVLNRDCPGIGTSGPGGTGGAGGPGGGLAGGSSRSQVPAAIQQRLQNCVTKVSATYHELVTYQPANRYWTFQWYDLAVFVGAALILGGFCLLWVRHRL